MIEIGINPIAFLGVRWYGIFIALALLLLRATNPISGIAEGFSVVLPRKDCYLISHLCLHVLVEPYVVVVRGQKMIPYLTIEIFYPRPPKLRPGRKSKGNGGNIINDA